MSVFTPERLTPDPKHAVAMLLRDSRGRQSAAEPVQALLTCLMFITAAPLFERSSLFSSQGRRRQTDGQTVKQTEGARVRSSQVRLGDRAACILHTPAPP